MKTILTFIFVVLFLCQLLSAQSVSLDHVDGLHDGNESEIIADGTTPIKFYIRFTNDNSNRSGVLNGFRVYSENGAIWQPIVGDTIGISKSMFDGLVIIGHYGVTGMDADTVSFDALTTDINGGLPPGYDDIAYSIDIGAISPSYHNKTICLDSATNSTNIDWEWGGEVIPAWDGPHCFTCINPNPTNINDLHSKELPDKYSLSQNYPNPFNPETKIEYILHRQSEISISIYNLIGQKINSLVNDIKPAGNYSVNWNGTDNNGNKMASGIYFYQLQIGDYTETKKMILMK
ncbi:MAG: T9SS type A sorting domain-containing protein [candidate division Zixibacteria bacterium]|nr:T9SS type A sorting domain-containing protein [candidate division Zixibacteria bacterium]